MQELLRNIQNRAGYSDFPYVVQDNAFFQGNYYNGEDEVQSQMTEYQQ